ncbi:MAG: ribosome recycling factor [Candidatus Auribacterota bacterium]|jgi:ribosome recycling factor|uniref:Ribosome-recycling factor n=1 Tax=Candidatus Auribacter fodinae TaxID=2093366 RepID=A0A3A4QY70_9BACT|nr:MAG: ribosome recycling factor [Candidatus Auribacter fodinae]
MPVNKLLEDTKLRMEKSVDHIRSELAAVRTSKASPALVENIMVEYYGSQTRLRDLAGISVPEARQILIQPWDVSAVSAIEKAILKSTLGITPSNDGKVIRLVFPELTQERREELLKVAKKIAEDGKIAVRNVRREANEELKVMEKASEITEDDRFKAEKRVQTKTDDFIHKIDEVLKDKEKEILTI